MSYFRPNQLLNNGEYRVIKTLGGGGFGVTYLAEDVKHKNKVAIKTLNAVVHGNAPYFEKLQDDFVSEALMLATCSYDNIVKIYPRFFREDGLYCIIMEYIEGINLVEYINDKIFFSEIVRLRKCRCVWHSYSWFILGKVAKVLNS